MNSRVLKKFILCLIYLQTIIVSTIPLRAEIKSMDSSVVSIYAVNVKTNEVVFDYNSHLNMTPASCLKIVTTAVALQVLGPDYCFQTDLEYDGHIDDQGILWGNIYIHGGGDPCLGSDRIAASLDWDKQIKVWAEEIAKLGIKSVKGTVIGDASKWEKAMAVPAWYWEDLGNYYGAGASALTFRENSYTLVFNPGQSMGDKTIIARTVPPMPSLRIYNEVSTGPAGSGDRACIYGSEFSWEQYVRGTVPAGVLEFSIKGAIPDPAFFCANTLKEALQRKGIFIEGQPLAQTSRNVFYTTFSPNLKEIVHCCNQISSNLHAEHLLKKVGEVSQQKGSTEGGIKAINAYLASMEEAKDIGKYQISDGSGLSRKTLVSTKLLVAVLMHIKKSDVFPFFLDSLPEEGKGIRAKSGHMGSVMGYSGYCGDIAFSILINHYLDRKQAKETIAQFFKEVTSFPIEES